jgi:hypothetical protein
MPRARTPLAKAKATGRTLHDPQRYKNRSEPFVKEPLGDPPKYMKKAEQKEAWRTLASEIPWLNSSHRSIVGIASEIYGKLIANEEVSINALNLLRLCLSQLGATPTSASNISKPDEDTDDDDVSKKYFQ